MATAGMTISRNAITLTAMPETGRPVQQVRRCPDDARRVQSACAALAISVRTRRIFRFSCCATSFAQPAAE
jgi:hypothetical protein